MILIAYGEIPPPMTDIMMMELPFFVFPPKPMIPRLNIVGKIMDMKKKIATSEQMDIVPRLETTIKDRTILVRA